LLQDFYLCGFGVPLGVSVINNVWCFSRTWEVQTTASGDKHVHETCWSLFPSNSRLFNRGKPCWDGSLGFAFLYQRRYRISHFTFGRLVKYHKYFFPALRALYLNLQISSFTIVYQAAPRFDTFALDAIIIEKRKHAVMMYKTKSSCHTVVILGEYASSCRVVLLVTEGKVMVEGLAHNACVNAHECSLCYTP
jgi:hypothetical protein